MKTTLDRELWRAIEAFDFDGGPAALTFEARLARENGWTRQFASRVVGEYRRFVYLAAKAGHPVTPSDEVDQAWHLHMTYTRSYWDRLCGEVLRKPLHHDPTRGGRDEGTKFEDWYAKTKETYAKVFGDVPPADVWPIASSRFGDAPHFARINTKRFWMIRKPAWRWKPAALAATGVGLVAALAGCVATLGQNTFGPGAIVLVAIAFAVAMLIVAVKRHGLESPGRRDSSGCGAGCSFAGAGGSGCGSHHGSSHSDGATDGGSSGGSGDGSDGGASSGCGSSGCGSSGCSGGGCGGGGCGGGCGS